MGVVRGCGSRSPGGIYGECSLSPFGRPLEEFLLDPPKIIDTDALGISPRGTHLREVSGVWHIFDWVGSQYYPNVADFVEEARRYGISRRLSPKLDYSKLTPQSRLILLHSRAFIDNSSDYNSHEPCIKNVPTHNSSVPMCIRLWWEDVEGAEAIPDTRDVIRVMPAFQYMAKSRPEGVEPEYKVAIFGTFPLSGIAVIRDPEGSLHEKALHVARKAKINVHLADE